MKKRAIGRRMAHKCLVLLVVALSTSRALAGPLTDSTAASDQCSELCPATANTKFAFDADQTYEYEYESDVKTSMGGASEEHSSLHLRSTARIEVISKCEMALSLTNVRMDDSNPSNFETRQEVQRSAEFKQSMEARTLRFSFVDGHVQSICADQEDPVWVVNIKRGILSAFQNTMESLDEDQRVFETDVAGTCPTEYENQGKTWSTRTVKKSKDLLGCVERNGPQSAFQGAPFQVPSDIQTLPIMKSSHECEQQMKGGILMQSVCKESHVFRPFSRQENGAKTEITSSLVFVKQEAGISRQRAVERVRSSLVFDHTLSAEEQAENMRQAKQTLKNLCAQSENDVRPDVPSLFTKFVRELRKLDTDNLARLFNAASQRICTKAEKYFRDAIPLVGTEGSINLIRQLMQSGRASDAEVDIWLTSIATSIHRPSKAMITAMKPMLNDGASRKTYLAVSSLVNNYCTLNEGCDSDAEVQSIVHFFDERLRYNCRLENPEEHDQLLAALKALGNTGHAQSAAPTLLRCANNNDLAMELRVAALQAFRRMACFADNAELFNILENSEVDSELRIHAYLVLMACPQEITLQRVLRILETEEVNQVGSFIWTHLTNLQETSNPHKQQIRAIVENEELKKTFDLDKRKFSRNIEMSLFSELLNMGGSVESNIIFSEKSYIPRSAMLNLTAELFGQSINFFELGGRLQGMEQLLERFFGPGGEMNDNREKRSVIRDDTINMLDRSFEAERERMGVSYFLRMFGNEIRYGDLHNFDLSNIKEKLNYLEWLIELANNHDFEVTKSLMFLDLTHVIPTAAGLPLKLEADGAATINVKVNGKMDIRRMFTSPSTFDISGSVAPSAALEITSTMGIDAFVAKTGLKMVTTLHTSTVAQGKFQLTDGKIFNFDWDIPREQMEIISAESKFYVLWREDEREQRMLNTGDRSSHAGCIGGKLTTVMGLELCGEISYPWDETRTEDVPFFPFTGPTSAKLYLNKRDTYTGFHFEAKYLQEKTRSQGAVQIKDIARVQFNTPGSSVDRELLFDFELDRAGRQIRLNMKSPWKKADLSGAVISTDAIRSISARALIDDATEYSATAQLTVEEAEGTIHYIPNVQIVIPRRENVVLEGSLIMRQNRKIDIDLALKNLLQRPISLRGSIDKLYNKRRMKYAGELQFASSFLNGNADGFVDHNVASGQSLASRLNIEYTYLEGTQQSIVLSNKIRDKSADGALSYSLDSAWRSTFWPRYDGEISMDFSLGANMVATNINVGLDEVRRIILMETANFNVGENSAAVTGTARFQFPLKYMDYEVKFDHMHTASELKTEGTLKAGGEEGSLTLGLKKESSTPLKMTGEAKLVYPGRDMAWTQSIDEKNPREYHHTLDVQLQKYENIHLESVYKMIPIHDLSATLNIPEFEPMSLNARVNPDVRDLLVHVDTTGLGNTYSGEVTSVTRGNFAPNFAIKNGLSLSWPGRQVEAKSEIMRKNEIVSVGAETTWDSDKKVTVNGELTMLKSTPALQMKVNWLDYFVGFDFEGKYQHQGWYTTEDDLQGKVRITSSFPGFEDLSASLKHDMTNDGLKTMAEAAWAPNQKVDAEFTLHKISGFNQVETVLEVNTPFNGYRILKGQVNYNLRGDSLETVSRFEVENSAVELALSGQVSLGAERLVRGTMTFTSPFTNFESITASLKHTDNGRNFNTNAETQWSSTGRISTQLKMSLLRRGYDMKNSGELVISTPFPGYRMSKVLWTHENDENKITHQTVIECETQRSLFELDGMRKASRSKHMWEVKTLLQTPFSIAKDIRLNVAHTGDMNSWENIKTEGTLQWARGSTISYEHEIDVTKDKLNLKSRFSSPFNELITLFMKNEFQGDAYTFNNELKYGNNKRITFDSQGSMQGTTFTGTSQVTTPCPYMEKVVLSKEIKYENGLWMASADLEFAPGKVIEVDGQLGIDSVKAFSLALKTPFTYIEDASFSTRFEGHGRDFESATEFNHNMLSDKISLLVKFDCSDLKRISGLVDFRSPFEVVRFAKSTLIHYRNNGGKILNKLSVDLPQYKGSINNDMKIHGWQMHTSKTEIQYIEGQKIEVSHDFSVAKNVAGKLSLKTPFAGMSDFALAFEHDGPSNDFKTTAVINYNGIRFDSETIFKLEGTALTASTKIETAYNLMALELTHNGDYRQFTNVFGINFNGKQMSASSEFSFNNFEPTGRITIVTPYSILRSLNLHFEHTGKSWHNFDNAASFEYNGQAYSAGSEFKWYGQNFRVKGKVNVPEEYSIKLVHKGQATDFTNTIVVVPGSDKLESNIALKLAENLLETSASVATPFVGYENFEVRISHEGPASNFRTVGNVITPFAGYQRMGAEITHSFQGSDLTTVIQITTPISTHPIVTLTMNHQGRQTNFVNTLTAEYAGKTVQASLRFAMTDAVSGTITLTTPYRNMEKFVAGFSHESNGASFKTSANIETPYHGYERMMAEYDHKATASGFNCNGRFESSIHKFQSIQLLINHEMSAAVLSSSLALETSYPGYQRFASSVNHDGGFRKMRSTGSLETPFAGFEHLIFDVNHDASNIRNIKSVASLSSRAAGSFEFNFGFNGYPNHFKASASMSTPIQHHNRYEIAVDHTARKNIATSVKLSLPVGDFTTTLEHEGPLNNFASRLQLNTPINGHERYSFAVTHECATTSSVSSFAEATLPAGVFNARLSHQGDTSNFNTKIEATTPFSGFNKYQINLEHSARDAGRISTSSQIIVPQGEVSFAFNHNGQPRKFESDLTVTTPFEGYNRFHFNIDHDCSVASQVKSDMRLSSSIGDFSTGLIFNGAPNSMTGSLHIATPFRDYERFETSFTHRSASLNDVVSTAEMILSGKRFAVDLSHKGDVQRFQNNIEITTPFSSFPRAALSVSHASPNVRNIDSQIRIETNSGDYALKLAHNGILKNLVSSLELTTPIRGYERTAAKIEHNIEDISNLISKSELHIAGDVHKHDFSFSGTPRNFRSKLVLNALAIETELKANDLSNLVSKTELTLPQGTFKIDFDFTGNSDDFGVNLILTTPFSGYETMSAKLNHNARDLSDIACKSELLTPIGTFKHDFTFSGTSDNFRMNFVLGTPFFDDMSAKVEHNAIDLSNLVSKSELDIPLGIFNHDFTFSGRLSDFRVQLVLGTPFYNDMSAMMENSIRDVFNVVSKSELSIPMGILKHDFTLSGRANDFRANLVLSSPYSDDITAKFEHSTLSNVVSKSELNIPVGIFKHDFTFSGRLNDFNANLVLSTPYSDDISAKLEHRTSSNIVSKSELNIPVGIFKHDFTLSGPLNDFNANLVLSSPYSDDITAKLEHSTSSNIMSKSELNIPVGIFKHDFTLSGRLNDFNANLVLSSPYSDDITAKLEHSTLSNTVSKSELKIPVGIFKHDFTLSGPLNDFNANLVLSSPYSDDITAKLEHRTSSNIVSKSELNIPVGIFKHDFTLSGRPNDFRANLVLSSPYSDDISAKLEHSTLSNIVSKSELNIPMGIFKHDFTLSGRLNDFNANLVLSSPYFDDITAKFEHSISSTILSKSELSIPVGIFKHDFSLSGTPSNFRANLILSTPFSDDVSIKLEHSGNDLSSVASKSELNIPVGIFKHELTLSARASDIRANLILSSPFFKDVSVSVEHNGNDLSNIVSKSEITLPAGLFKHEFTFAGRLNDFRANLMLSTPFSGYESMSAKLDLNTASLSNIVSKAELTIPSGTFSQDLTFSGTPHDFTGRFTLNTPYIENLEGSIRHSHQGLRRINSVAQISGAIGQFGLNFDHETSSTQFSSSLIATSSITGFERIAAKLSHSGQSIANIKSALNVESPWGNFGGSIANEASRRGYTSMIEATSSFAGYEKFSIGVDHEGNSLAKFETNLSVTSSWGNFGARVNHNSRPLATTLSISTPFSGYEEMSISFTLSGNFESALILNIPVGQFRLSLANNDQETAISLATPFKGYEQMSASLRRSSSESSVVFVTPFGEFQVVYMRQGAVSRIAVATPFSGYENMMVSLSHSAPTMSDIQTGLSLDIPAGLFEINFRHEGSLSRFASSLEVRTPITGYERTFVSLRHSCNGWSQMETTLVLNVPTGEYQLSLAHNGIDMTFNSGMTLTTPIIGYERLAAHMRRSENGESSMTLDIPSGEYEVSLNNQATRDQFAYSSTLRTPFKGYERMTFSINHEASASRMESSIGVEIPSGEYKITATREGTYAEFTATLVLTTPLRSYERMSATLSHSSSKTALTMNTPAGEFEVSSNFKGVASDFTYTMAVTTPFRGYEKMSGEMRHTAVDRTNMKTVLALNIPSGEYQLSVDLVQPMYTLTVVTPVRGYERMSVSLRHTGPTVTLQFNLPSGEYEINCEHEGAREQFASSVTMKTPFRGYESMTASVRHSARDLSNIDSALAAETSLGRFGLGLKHTGTAKRFTSSLSLATPFRGYEKMALTADHSASDLKNILSSLSLETPIGQYGAAFSHQGLPSRFRTAVDITSPHSAWNKITLAAENNSPSLSNIDAGFKITLPAGEYAYSLRHDGSAKEFTTRYTVSTPYNNYDVNALLEHSARDLSNIRSKLDITSYWGNMGYNLEHTGNQQKFKTDFSLSTPFRGYERMGAIVEHDAVSYSNIQSSTQFNSPLGMYKYHVGFSGRPDNFRTTLNINTPFNGYEEMTAALEHAGRDMSSIKTTATLTMSAGVFSASIDNTGSLRKFVTISEVSTPFEGHRKYKLHLENDMVSLYNMMSKAILSIPQGEIRSSISYNGNPSRFSAGFDINTPFEAFRKFEIAMNHAASSFRQIASSASVITPVGTYGYDIKHTGDWKRMSCSYAITTPFRGYENKLVTVEHDASSLSNIETTIKSGSYQLALNHHGHLKNFRSSLILSLPYRGFEETGIRIENSLMDLSAIKSAISIAAPIGSYDYNLQFNGSPKVFNTVFELKTPHQKLNIVKISADVDVSSLNAIRLSSELVTPIGQYEFRMSHNGNPQQFRNEAELITPHAPYNKFAYAFSFALSRGFRLNGEMTTSVPSFERFTLDVSHEGKSDGFRTTAEATTSIPEYNRFVVSVEHTGSQESPRIVVSIQTPFQNHESYTLTTEKSGRLAIKSELQTPHGMYSGSFSTTGSNNNFKSEALLTMPLSGLERFAFEMAHRRESDRSRSHVQISTPFRHWENFGARMTHDIRNNIRSALTITSSYPGFEEFVAALTHEGSAQNFNTDLQFATPINGYKNFGFNVNHAGHSQEFNTRGTIKLPFFNMPAATVAISHRGSLLDFQTTGSIEYNSKRIDGEAEFKRTGGRSGTNYQGTFTLSSPFDMLRRLSVTGVHTRNGDIKTGSLDVMHNGQQMADFDYSYNTGALKNVEIEIRKPYGMATKVNVAGERNDATFNWDTSRTDSQIRFDLNLKNEETEKELTIKAVLPTRTIGFTSTYVNAEGRMTQATEIMWDSAVDAKASYHIELSTTNRRGQKVHDGRLSLASPMGGLDATFNHISNPGRQSTTEIRIQRLSIRNEMAITSNGFKHTLTAEHPNLPSGLKVVTEGAYEGPAVDGSVELSYADEVFKFVGHFSDASYYSQTVYNFRAQLTHPNSNLDAQWEAQYKDESDVVVWTMNGKYLTSYDQQMKTGSLRAEINKLRKALNIEVITPVQTMALTAHETSSDAEHGIHNFEITGTLGEHSIRGDFNINSEEMLVEMKLYKDEDLLELTAQMMSAMQAKVEVSTTIDEVRRQHALASIGISSDNLISTRFFMSPTIQDELSEFISEIQKTSTYRRMSRTFQAAFENEIAQKQRMLSRSIEPFQPAIQFASEQITAITSTMQSAFRAMIQNNYFYARDITTYIQSTASNMKNTYDMTMLYNVAESMQTVGGKVLQKVTEILVNTRPYWTGVFTAARKTTLYVINEVRNNKVLNYVWDKFMTLDIPELINPIEEQYNKVQAFVDPYLNDMKVWWSKIEARPETKYIKAHLKRTLARTSFAARYMEVDERIKETLRELHHISLATYRSQLIKKIRDYLQLERNAWSVWNPQSGEIGFDMYWPFHWDDVHHLARVQNIDFGKYISMAKDSVQKLLPTIPEMPRFAKFNIYDYYYAYKPSSDVYNWVPPFKAYAAVMGDQHYMTFDKKFFEFAGQCSYLLARDFIDGTFSVVVNYENQNNRPVKKSLTVMSNNKQVEIFNDARVVVDGSRVELPLTFGNTTITRVGSIVRVDNTHGVTVACNLVYNSCTVNVTGWYFSKTGGLFGTYNNEPSDDFTTAENTRADTPEQLADSWTAGQRCRPENFAANLNPEPNTEAYRICSNLFEQESSLLRPCFNIVKPKPFQKMCENDMQIKENRLPTEKDACNAAAFYVDVCRREGVNIRVPNTCVRCSVESLGAEFTEGQNFTLQGDTVPQSADVVFLLQHAQCNQEVVSKLKDVVDDMEVTYKRMGITNNRYAIVGYGASGVLNAPHVRTMDGQIFNTHDKFLLGLDEFAQKEGHNADALAAIFYASKLPFRAGVSKTFIIVPCSTCQEVSTSYADVEQVLLQKNIHLHMLMEHSFRLTVDKDPVSAYIFGLDKTRVFTRKDAGGSDLVGDRELRQQVQVPKDLCAALALESDGSIFNTLQWTQSRPYMQKRFMDVMVRLMAEKGRPESCQKCDCVSDEAGVGRAVCKTCQSTRSFYSFLPGFEMEERSSEEAPAFSYEESEASTEAPRLAKKQRRRMRSQKTRRN